MRRGKQPAPPKPNWQDALDTSSEGETSPKKALDKSQQQPEHESPKNNHDLAWLKRELEGMHKIWKQIMADAKDDTDFLASLPDPLEFLENGDEWRREWKTYVDKSVNKLNDKYPNMNKKYIDYIHKLRLWEHNSADNIKPKTPEFPDEYKSALTKIRTLFDCREYRYMEALSQMVVMIKHEFPELLD